jgi:hypothetical protein
MKANAGWIIPFIIIGWWCPDFLINDPVDFSQLRCCGSALPHSIETN